MPAGEVPNKWVKKGTKSETCKQLSTLNNSSLFYTRVLFAPHSEQHESGVVFILQINKHYFHGLVFGQIWNLWIACFVNLAAVLKHFHKLLYPEMLWRLISSNSEKSGSAAWMMNDVILSACCLRCRHESKYLLPPLHKSSFRVLCLTVSVNTLVAQRQTGVHNSQLRCHLGPRWQNSFLESTAKSTQSVETGMFVAHDHRDNSQLQEE